MSYISMHDNEDWLWRPVMRGMLKAESLLDPGISLGFVALCNEAITVEQENQARHRRAASAKNRR